MTSTSTYSDKAETPPSQPSPPSHPFSEFDNLPVKPPPPPDQCWLHRKQPDTGEPRIIVSQEAWQQIAIHAASNLRTELGGALLGQAYRYEDKVFVEIKAALPAVSQDHGPVHFTFAADSWSQLHQDRTEKYPNLEIIGWFHTHPDLGVFYSSDDVVVHSAAFTLPWHVGLVVDPVRQEAGFFGWVHQQLTPLSGFYELLDTHPESILHWQVVRTAVWYDDTYEYEYEDQHPAPPPAARVYTSARGPSLTDVSSQLGWLVGAVGLILSLILLFGYVLPLNRQINQQQAVLLNIADAALADSNAATCPDPRLRILSPVGGSAYAAGESIDILGTADHPNADRYRLEVRPSGSEAEWQLLNTRDDTSLGALAEWDTSAFVPALYDIRLTAVDNNNVRLAYTDLCTINLQLLAP